MAILYPSISSVLIVSVVLIIPLSNVSSISGTAHKTRYPCGVGSWVAVAAILSAPALLVSTTMLDRLGFYLIGIQPYVLVRFPGLFSAPVVRGPFVCMIILCYAAVLWVWFSYGHHVAYWRPYASGLFQ